ncbi:plasmid mobilization protein [Spirosoma jeollabukense]
MTLYTQLPSYRRLLRAQCPPPGFTLRYRAWPGQGRPRHPQLPHNMETTLSKTHRLDLRVTEEERKKIAQKAEAAGLKVSEYLRRSALGSKPAATLAAGSEGPAILTKPERAQLASIANNLNQLTRYAHTGQFDLAGIQALITQLNQLLV